MGKQLIWIVLAILGAFALGYIALNRGEQINALWIVVAAVCVYLIAYRYYGLFIAKKVLQVDSTRMTPSIRHNDGLDYVPTDKKNSLRSPFCSNCRGRTTGRPGISCSNGVSARHVMATSRGRISGCGSRFYGAFCVDSSRWPLTG